MKTLPIELLREFFSYDPETGVLTWKKSTNNRMKLGKAAGYQRKNNDYTIVGLCGLYVFAHRIAWAMHYGSWPDCQIDHINRVKSDNRISNLRLCDQSENMMNRGQLANNASGAKGVHWHKEGKAWQAQIRVRGEYVYLGLFDSVEEASRAYQERAAKEFGEFAVSVQEENRT